MSRATTKAPKFKPISQETVDKFIDHLGHTNVKDGECLDCAWGAKA